MATNRIAAGVDAGTECIKVAVIDGEHRVRGRGIVQTRGYFQDCIHEAMGNALREAQAAVGDLSGLCVSGFGASCAPGATQSVPETWCHARGAFHQLHKPMTLIDLGGRDPKVIRVDEHGRVGASRSARKCAVGIGTFLMFAARHLAVHPTRLMELASTAERPGRIGSYCSVLAEVDVIELLRDGSTAAEVALGCMHSIAERILEMGGLAPPVAVTGGVCEYFPGVVTALAERSGIQVEVVPEPILAGALGAALFALDGEAR